MSIEQVSNLKFEIGHVLFIDIIGHSELLATNCRFCPALPKLMHLPLFAEE